MTIRFRPRILLTLAAMAMVLLAGTANAAPITIMNSDFEATGGTSTGTNWNTVHNWNEGDVNGGPEYVYKGGTQWAPQDTQTLYLTGNTAAVNQDLSHNWASTDLFTLTFDGYDAGWRIGNAGDAISAQLRETDGTILWDSGSLNLDGTVTGSQNNLSFTGTGHEFSFDIDASTFAGVGGAVEGSALNLRFGGVGVAFADNVTLDLVDVTAVPEPASIAIWTILGLCLAGYGYRRRKQ